MKTNKNKKFDKKPAVLENSKKEIQNRLDIKNLKLSNIEQNFRRFEKYGDINPLDLNNIDQHDDEINLKEFLDIAVVE